MTTKTETTQVYEVTIAASPEDVWDALTKPDLTKQYFYGSVLETSWEPGSPYLGRTDDGTRKFVQGELLEVDPPRRLSMTWSSLWDEEAAKEEPSRVTWELEPTGDGTKVTLVHDRLEASPKTATGVSQGWQTVLDGLKSFLETGKPQNQG
jgi:uncharacterized protein YndB with AHSA1/START domain